jgi:uncharacterized iron-regulated membrane protein
VDASTGNILGELQQVRWVDWMVDLHRNLLTRKTGRQVVGGFGVISTLLGLTGLLLWFLGGAKWRAWVMVRSNGGPRRFNYDLHRASGLWVMAFLLVLSFTGIELAYPQSFRSAWEKVTGLPSTVKAPTLAKGSKHQKRRSLDEYIATARAAMPDGAPMELRLSESAKTPAYLRLRRAGDLSAGGSNRVYMDPASGKVLSAERAADWPLGVQLFQAIQPIHYGEFGGAPIKVLWSLFGVIPAVLFITGVIVWWRPNKQKARRSDVETAVEQEDTLEEPVRS